MISDRPAALVWDGKRLPGLWLADRAVAAASERARSIGLAAVAIRNSHHIGCLAVFLERPARGRLMAIVASSDPSVKGVAPFGGTAPLMTPNPLGDRHSDRGRPDPHRYQRLDHHDGTRRPSPPQRAEVPASWAIDAEGNPTDDPAVLTQDPPGTILPVGGLDHGHKGYALGLLVETLTQATSGSAAPTRPRMGRLGLGPGHRPALFAGLGAFTRQTSWLAAGLPRQSAPAGVFPPCGCPGSRGWPASARH